MRFRLLREAAENGRRQGRRRLCGFRFSDAELTRHGLETAGLIEDVGELHAHSPLPPFSTNVSFMITRYSVTLPFATSTLWSLTHAPVMPLMVCEAREMPLLTASSKLLELVEMISITLATDM